VIRFKSFGIDIDEGVEDVEGRSASGMIFRLRMV
jgi:hypothetical protein